MAFQTTPSAVSSVRVHRRLGGANNGSSGLVASRAGGVRSGRVQARAVRLVVTAQQQSVVITGASSGIGRAAAIRLANDGWRVFAGVRKESDGEALDKEHSLITPVRLDVGDAASVKQAMEEVRASVGDDGLDGLINNAGVAMICPLELVPEEDFSQVFDINVTGPLRVTQQFLPLLRQSQGRIINMGSQSGTLAYPGFGAYSCSKFALEAFSDTLRMEVKQFGIEVVHINPGVVKTAIWERGNDRSKSVMDGVSDNEAYGLYKELNYQILEGAAAAETKGVGVEATSLAIVDALTNPKPKTRVIVGQKAMLLMRLRRYVLPDRFFDWIVLNTLSKYSDVNN